MQSWDLKKSVKLEEITGNFKKIYFISLLCSNLLQPTTKDNYGSKPTMVKNTLENLFKTNLKMFLTHLFFAKGKKWIEKESSEGYCPIWQSPGANK